MNEGLKDDFCAKLTVGRAASEEYCTKPSGYAPPCGIQHRTGLPTTRGSGAAQAVHGGVSRGTATTTPYALQDENGPAEHSAFERPLSLLRACPRFT